MHSTVNETPVAAPMRRRLTVDEYHRMGEAGILGEDNRVELIDGELVTMAPIGSGHAYIVDLMTDSLVRQVPRNCLVRIQNPIQLGDFGEPEPDMAIVKRQNYRLQHPQASDVLVLVEVAETSLKYDRTTKLRLYARFGIPEVWIIDVDGKRVEVYRTPQADAQTYQDVRRYTKGFVVPEAIPGIELRVADLWS